MPRETSSPIDLADPPLERPGLGWTSATLALATFLLLVANAVSLRDWIDDLPPSPAQAQASTIVGRWLEASEAIGIGRPRAWLHELWKQAEAARFPS